MNKPLRILIVEDLATDVELIKHALKKLEMEIQTDVTSTERDYEKKLKEFAPDLILLDYALNEGFDGLRALAIIQEYSLNIPVIIVSGSIGEERAVELFQKGAVDFISKQKLDRLVPAIQRALKEVEESKKLIATQNKLKSANEALKKKIQDLESLNKSMVGRELKMIELKEEIKQLKMQSQKNES